MGKPGRPGGMVQRIAVVTPALQAASGIFSLRQAASMLEVSYPQVYRWVYEGLPTIRKGRAFLLDAESLRAWIRSNRPWVWVPRVEDGLMWETAEYERRRTACQRMMERWGVPLSR